MRKKMMLLFAFLCLIISLMVDIVFSGTVTPTRTPTAAPTAKPTAKPSAKPTAKPTSAPSVKPTVNPTAAPSRKPSPAPSAKPSPAPTAPTFAPSVKPTAAPTTKPSPDPTASPTANPTASPSAIPTAPTANPTTSPTATPTTSPTAKPTSEPTTASPTFVPSAAPSASPTVSPTAAPTTEPTAAPTAFPTAEPTASPTASPTPSPTPEPSWSYRPTAYPTSQPSCSIGVEGIGVNCQICAPGFFAVKSPTVANEQICKPCPQDSISTEPGSLSCTACIFPHTTYKEGMNECSAFSFNTGDAGTWTTVGILSAIFLMCLWFAGEYRRLGFILMLLPMSDYVSDILYIQQSLFYDEYLFWAGFTFIFLSDFIFVYELSEMNSVLPKLWSLDVVEPYLICVKNNGYYPILYGRSISLFTPYSNSTVKYFLLPFLWIALGVYQLILELLYLTVLLVHVACLIVWLALALVLYPTKVFAIGRVMRFWLRIWTGDDVAFTDHFGEKLIDLDTGMLNKSLMAEFVLETLPQLGLQTYNNQMTETWTPIGYFSAILSVVIAFNGVYRYLYWTAYKGIPFEDVPVEVNINVAGFKVMEHKVEKRKHRRRRSSAISTNNDLRPDHPVATDEHLDEDDEEQNNKRKSLSGPIKGTEIDLKAVLFDCCRSALKSGNQKILQEINRVGHYDESAPLKPPEFTLFFNLNIDELHVFMKEVDLDMQVKLYEVLGFSAEAADALQAKDDDEEHEDGDHTETDNKKDSESDAKADAEGSSSRPVSMKKNDNDVFKDVESTAGTKNNNNDDDDGDDDDFGVAGVADDDIRGSRSSTSEKGLASGKATNPRAIELTEKKKKKNEDAAFSWVDAIESLTSM